MTELLSALKGLMQRSHGDLMSYVAVQSQVDALEQQKRTTRRLEAQVDARQRSMCPNYELPEGDQMGSFINAGIIADEKSLTQLVQALQKPQDMKTDDSSVPDAPAKPTTDYEPPPPTQTVTPEPEPAEPATPTATKSLAAKILPTGLAIAGGLAAGAIANEYFGSDSVEVYDVQGELWSPDATDTAPESTTSEF